MRNLVLLSLLLSACSGAVDNGFQPLSDGSGIIGGSDIRPDNIINRQALSFRSYYDPVVKKEDRGDVIVTTTSYKVLQCTASAIAPRIVITAAHCLHPSAALQKIEYKKANGEASVQQVLSVTAHPKYSADNKVPDLAILFLEKNLPDDVKILNLPMKDQDLQLSVITAAGFGRNNGLVKIANAGLGVLRAVELKVLDYSDRQPLFSVDQSEGKGICQGDSGGPALAEKDGITYVVGVASRSRYYDNVPPEELNTCNLRGEYVNVQYEMDWITETMELLSKSY